MIEEIVCQIKGGYNSAVKEMSTDERSLYT